jgi:hypothetical protein
MKVSSSSSLKSWPLPFKFTISISCPSVRSVRVHVAVASSNGSPTRLTTNRNGFNARARQARKPAWQRKRPKRQRARRKPPAPGMGARPRRSSICSSDLAAQRPRSWAKRPAGSRTASAVSFRASYRRRWAWPSRPSKTRAASAATPSRAEHPQFRFPRAAGLTPGGVSRFEGSSILLTSLRAPGTSPARRDCPPVILLRWRRVRGGIGRFGDTPRFCNRLPCFERCFMPFSSFSGSSIQGARVHKSQEVLDRVAGRHRIGLVEFLV